MVTTRRMSTRSNFTPPALDRVTGYLHHLTEAGQGWINLLPGVDAEEEERQTMPPGLFSLFTNRQPPVTMATLVPPRPARRGIEGVTVGLLHPTGAKAGRGWARPASPSPGTGGCARTTPGVGWSCWRRSARPMPTSSTGPSGPVPPCVARK